MFFSESDTIFKNYLFRNTLRSNDESTSLERSGVVYCKNALDSLNEGTGTNALFRNHLRLRERQTIAISHISKVGLLGSLDNVAFGSLSSGTRRTKILYSSDVCSQTVRKRGTEFSIRQSSTFSWFRSRGIRTASLKNTAAGKSP